MADQKTYFRFYPIDFKEKKKLEYLMLPTGGIRGHAFSSSPLDPISALNPHIFLHAELFFSPQI